MCIGGFPTPLSFLISGYAWWTFHLEGQARCLGHKIQRFIRLAVCALLGSSSQCGCGEANNNGIMGFMALWQPKLVCLKVGCQIPSTYSENSDMFLIVCTFHFQSPVFRMEDVKDSVCLQGAKVLSNCKLSNLTWGSPLVT